MKECPACHYCFGDHMNVCDRDANALVDLIPGPPIFGQRFRVDRKIGAGSLSLIFQGTSIENNEKLLIRVILPEILALDPGLPARFQQQAGIATDLLHENIARVLGYGNEYGLLYFVNESFDGYSLSELLSIQRDLPLERVLSIMTQVSEGVAAGHRRNVFHRDLKLSNIFVATQPNIGERIKIFDFCFARLKSNEMIIAATPEQREQILGLPYYSAPELLRGQVIDGRVDVYSIGAIFYDMVTGQPPFTGNSFEELREQHINSRPRPLRELRADIPPPLEALIMKTLEKRPAQRPTNALNLAVQLAAQLAAFRELMLTREVSTLEQTVEQELPPMINTGITVIPLTASVPELPVKLSARPISTLSMIPISREELAKEEAKAATPAPTFMATTPLSAIPLSALGIPITPQEDTAPYKLSPCAILYLFAAKFLPKMSQGVRRRQMHEGFCTERERLAAMLLTTAIFSLRDQEGVKVITGNATVPKWQNSMKPQRTEGLVIDAANLDVTPLDLLEEKVINALKDSSPQRPYNIFLHIAKSSVATVEGEAICEIVSDCIADELAVKGLLKSVRRTTKLKPGESAIHYDLKEDISQFNGQASILQNWLEEIQQEPPVSLGTKKIQPFDHVLKYYTDLFRHNSRELGAKD